MGWLKAALHSELHHHPESVEQTEDRKKPHFQVFNQFGIKT